MPTQLDKVDLPLIFTFGNQVVSILVSISFLYQVMKDLGSSYGQTILGIQSM